MLIFRIAYIHLKNPHINILRYDFIPEYCLNFTSNLKFKITKLEFSKFKTHVYVRAIFKIRTHIRVNCFDKFIYYGFFRNCNLFSRIL